MTQNSADIAIIGGGAAGLAAAIFAGEAAAGTGLRVVVLEGARKPGAKILVSGGGRCNVTNAHVAAEDYCGGPQPLIRSVLKAFDEERTVRWLEALSVPLKLEPTGKYFPRSDSARTVLDALLARVRALGVEFWTGWRATGIEAALQGFVVHGRGVEDVWSRRVIMATGGLSLPKSGSDGAGLNWMRQLGHTVVPTTPALAPLVMESTGGDLPFEDFSGVSVEGRLALADGEGRAIAMREGAVLFTHFGVSGPGPMDLSRHVARWRLEHPGAAFQVTMGAPNFRGDLAAADRWLLERAKATPSGAVWRAVAAHYPERMARAIAGDDSTLGHLSKERRRRLAWCLVALPLPVIGDRGYTFAETTAGGVDLREIDIRTMESRRVDGLHLCGEMLDVDGRIGGFNFQWAWSSGYLAGRGAVAALARQST